MENALQGSQRLHRRILVESLLPPKKRKFSYTTGISLQVDSFSNAYDGKSLSDKGDESSIPFLPKRALRRNMPRNTIRRAHEKQKAAGRSAAEAVARKEEEEIKLQLRQKEREATRIQIEKMEKTVEFNDYFYALLDLKKMGSNLNTYGSLSDDELYKNTVKWSLGRFP